jgi:16S rRNA (uracil1498-N3)-methyltransferase
MGSSDKIGLQSAIIVIKNSIITPSSQDWLEIGKPLSVCSFSMLNGENGMRYFFIEANALEAQPVMITGSDANHIRNVLRSRPGDIIGVLDGKGKAYQSEIIKISTLGIELNIQQELPVEPPPPVRLVVAQAYLKDKKMDRLVRRLCELGMVEWRPFVSARSVARPPEKRIASRLERWQSIAREAIKQCHRADLPVLHPCCSFGAILENSRDCSHKMMFWEEAPQACAWSDFGATVPETDGVMVMLGPEGGFTGDEVARARAHGFTIAGLGPRVLRADTAALAAATIVQYVFGDMGPKTY